MTVGGGTSRLDARGIIVFCVFAFGLAWGLVGGIYYSGAWERSARTALIAVMFAPMIATFLAALVFNREVHLRQVTGLRLGEEGTRWVYLAVWFGTPVVALAALGLSVLAGTLDADLAHYSGMRAELDQTPGGKQVLEQVSLPLFVWSQVLSATLLGPILNGIFAFGEEWGWRGYLLPKLVPLGRLRALLLSGVIWGLWHAPLILLGHNYPQHPRLGVAAMVLFCVLMGLILGWTRLYTQSVLPAVAAHGSVNAFGRLPELFFREGTPLDGLQVGIIGWPGWLVLTPLAIAVVLHVRKTERRPVAS